MTISKLLSAAAVAAAVLFTPALSAAAQQDFKLTNKTGYTISEVYVSPAKASDWQEDVMGDDTLEDGQAVDISFNRASPSCVWDLKVVYDDNTSAEWSNFNLCTISNINIFYAEDTGKTWATWK